MTKKEADAFGRRLRKQYGLKGWSISVWENLGWHVKLVSPNGWWKVYPNLYNGIVIGFHAFLSEPGETGAEPGWVKGGKTPLDAMDAVRKNMIVEVERLKRKLEIAMSA